MHQLILAAAVLALAGCAHESSVHADVHCVKEGQRGRCAEWRVGPTPKQLEAFEKRKAATP